MRANVLRVSSHVPAFPTNLERKRKCEEALRITAWEAGQIPELKTQCKDPLRANVYFLQFTQKMKPLMINDSKTN